MPPRLWKHGITFALGSKPRHRLRYGLVPPVRPKRAKVVKLPPRLLRFAGWQMVRMLVVDNEVNPAFPHYAKHLYFKSHAWRRV